jgi:hypothetical protein
LFSLYREIIAICCENNTKHVNTLCGLNLEFLLLLNLVVHKVTIRNYRGSYSRIKPDILFTIGFDTVLDTNYVAFSII